MASGDLERHLAMLRAQGLYAAPVTVTAPSDDGRVSLLQAENQQLKDRIAALEAQFSAFANALQESIARHKEQAP